MYLISHKLFFENPCKTISQKNVTHFEKKKTQRFCTIKFWLI